MLSSGFANVLWGTVSPSKFHKWRRQRASQMDTRLRGTSRDLPKSLPEIELYHGEALSVLARLGFQGATSKGTFQEYIKSLRKFGSPFERGKKGLAGRGRAKNYSYCHLMELALALTLRVYHVVPDSILAEIVRHRTSLYRYYRRAYAERCTGLGAPITVVSSGHAPIHMRGVFLDLKINFSGGTLTSFGPSEAISPFEAFGIFADRDLAARALLPINLSLLSERLVSATLRVRRGLGRAAKTRR
jgi:hypothetical protein